MNKSAVRPRGLQLHNPLYQEPTRLDLINSIKSNGAILTRAVRKVLRQSPFKRKLLVYQHKTSHVTCFRCILYYFVWKTEIILLGTFLSLL